jgi:hypothetical protein
MIPIDDRTYQASFGHAPVGRRYWSFRIVCNTRVETFRTESAMTYVAACEEVQKRAAALGAASIVVDE